MPPLLAALHAKGILTDDLTVPGEAGAHQKKYMGVARWERMIPKSSTWGEKSSPAQDSWFKHSSSPSRHHSCSLVGCVIKNSFILSSENVKFKPLLDEETF